jgi:murein DD-endopeptidase MepM/ murein hydrolase activator NlpD
MNNYTKKVKYFLFTICFLFNLSCYFKPSNLTMSDLNIIFASKNFLDVDGFDFPVGKPDGLKYYNAQKFGKRNPDFANNYHLGEDWNGVGGGNSDYGAKVFSISNGYVFCAKDYKGGIGRVVRIIHKMKNGEYIESLYFHLSDILIKEGAYVRRGEQIGNIGNANGLYYAHLHFEMRSKVLADLGGGYADTLEGFLCPTKFINKNRP